MSPGPARVSPMSGNRQAGCYAETRSGDKQMGGFGPWVSRGAWDQPWVVIFPRGGGFFRGGGFSPEPWVSPGLRRRHEPHFLPCPPRGSALTLPLLAALHVLAMVTTLCSAPDSGSSAPSARFLPSSMQLRTFAPPHPHPWVILPGDYRDHIGRHLHVLSLAQQSRRQTRVETRLSGFPRVSQANQNGI